jgi:hypothetical protein
MVMRLCGQLRLAIMSEREPTFFRILIDSAMR